MSLAEGKDSGAMIAGVSGPCALLSTPSRCGAGNELGFLADFNAYPSGFLTIGATGEKPRCNGSQTDVMAF